MGINGLLAISVLQGAASLLLFLLYLLLYASCPERFFRYWLAGWLLNILAAVCTLVPKSWGGGSLQSVGIELSFGASLFFLATIFQYIGQKRALHYLWPAGALAVGIVAMGFTGIPVLAGVRWAARPAEATVSLAAGWLLWRAMGRARGYGAVLLAAPLLLRGLHMLDRGSWAELPEVQIRIAFDALFSVAAGVGMAVLVLEGARARTEDLNAKLGRLTLMTTAATETLSIPDVLEKALAHLTESLGVSHGFIRLLEGMGEAAQLVLRAAVGFREDLRREHNRVPASEPWVRLLFAQESTFFSAAETSDAELRQWLKMEGLAALLVV